MVRRWFLSNWYLLHSDCDCSWSRTRLSLMMMLKCTSRSFILVWVASSMSLSYLDMNKSEWQGSQLN